MPPLKKEYLGPPEQHPLLSDATLVVYDMECTGLNWLEEEIIQIGAFRVRGLDINQDNVFFTYVDPGREITPFIENYTGVTDADLRGAPPPAEALKAFSRFAGDAVLVAHNARKFDLPFLAHSIKRAGLETRPAGCLDSVDIAQSIWEDYSGLLHGLDEIVTRLDVSDRGTQRHDARGDALLLARVMVALHELYDLEKIYRTVPVHEGALAAE